MNILVVSSKYPPEYAGSALRAHNTYKRLREKYSISYSVLCGSVIYNRCDSYIHEGVEVHRIAAKIFRNAKSTQETTSEPIVKRWIRKLKNGINYICEASATWIYLIRHARRFDLIHIFGNNYVTAAALTYARFTNKPIMVEFCNLADEFRFYEPSLVRMIFGKALPARSKAICISPRAAWMCSASGYADDAWCRPNPVDTNRFFREADKRLLYRERLGLFGRNDIVIINISKIYPLKNQVFLVDILKDLPDPYKLVIAGPLLETGPNRDRDKEYLKLINSKIKEYGLQDRVKLIPHFIKNADEYMKASDIYALTSTVEACATPILEALACGLPVVANRIEGVTTEWIEDNVNGYIADINNIRDFRDKLEQAALLDVKNLTNKITQDASADSIDERYMKLAKELIDVTERANI